jgi:hypothetical protein
VSAKAKDVGEYLEALAKSREGKTQVVRDALDAYLELWAKALEKGIVAKSDSIEAALSKVDEAGGLYEAAQD